MLNNQPLGGRTGGVYIPPFKLELLKKQQLLDNQNQSENLQKLSWEALRKSINGLINKVNVTNIKNIVPELFQENLIRGRGLFARAIMKAQLASPGFTHIYSSLIAVINTKLPENGELILKRVIYGFKRAYKRRDKVTATAFARFIAHLVNHQVAHEILALQLLTVLLEEPSDDSVEIAVGFVKEVGQMLEELSPQGLHYVFERFRNILHEGDIDKRVQYTIEGLFAVRKSNFKDYPAISKDLDLVEREDQITFEVGLDDEIDKEEMLDIFRFDPNFQENECLWEQIRKEILGDDEEECEEGQYDSEIEGDALGENNALVAIENNNTVTNGNQIIDLTEAELINLRRSIYLTIMSSVSFEECCHKLAKLRIPDGYESELCNMLVECCSNERSYLRYYGFMGQRFCMMHRKYQDAFDQVFLTQYNTIHRLETNKLRNVAKFMGHLLCTDALPWTCLEYIKLNEFDTTSSSRIFIKVLIQELAEMLGMAMIIQRFSDPHMQDVFSGLFPTDNARNTRFAINFFTSIGLGSLTDGLREHLKNAPKLLALQMQKQLLEQQQMKAIMQKEQSSTSDSDSSSNSSSSSSSGSSGSSSSSSSDSDSDSSSSTSRSSSPSPPRRVSKSSKEKENITTKNDSDRPHLHSSKAKDSPSPPRRERNPSAKVSPSPPRRNSRFAAQIQSTSSPKVIPTNTSSRETSPSLPRRTRKSSPSSSPLPQRRNANNYNTSNNNDESDDIKKSNKQIPVNDNSHRDSRKFEDRREVDSRVSRNYQENDHYNRDRRSNSRDRNFNRNDRDRDHHRSSRYIPKDRTGVDSNDARGDGARRSVSPPRRKRDRSESLPRRRKQRISPSPHEKR